MKVIVLIVLLALVGVGVYKHQHINKYNQCVANAKEIAKIPSTKFWQDTFPNEYQTNLDNCKAYYG